jgi:hypothetical protein
MLPKIMAYEDLPKPHRKVSRLKTIGHQIRYHHYSYCIIIYDNLPQMIKLRKKEI